VALIRLVVALGSMAVLAGLIAWPFLRTSTSAPQNNDVSHCTDVVPPGIAEHKPVLGSTPQCQSEHSV